MSKTPKEIATHIFDEASPEDRARVILRLLNVEEYDGAVIGIAALIRTYGVAEDYTAGDYSGSDAVFVAKYGVDTVAAAIRAQS